MTSFSMPSIALSNSASEALRQTSDSRILPEMNYFRTVSAATNPGSRTLTFRNSLISFTWSFTVNVRFVKLLKNLRNHRKRTIFVRRAQRQQIHGVHTSAGI